MSLGLSKYEEIPGSQCECFTLSLKSENHTPRRERKRQTDKQGTPLEISRLLQIGLHQILTEGCEKCQQSGRILILRQNHPTRIPPVKIDSIPFLLSLQRRTFLGSLDWNYSPLPSRHLNCISSAFSPCLISGLLHELTGLAFPTSTCSWPLSLKTQCYWPHWMSSS